MVGRLKFLFAGQAKWFLFQGILILLPNQGVNFQVVGEIFLLISRPKTSTLPFCQVGELCFLIHLY